jgi:hypothetical protein
MNLWGGNDTITTEIIYGAGWSRNKNNFWYDNYSYFVDFQTKRQCEKFHLTFLFTEIATI